jgi:AraC family transcriptional regulator
MLMIFLNYSYEYQMIPPRKLDEYELLYFPDGSRTVYRIEGKAFTLKEPCFIICRPNEYHEYEYDAVHPSRHLFIHFQMNASPDYVSNLHILHQDGPSYVPMQEELLIAMMKQVLYIAYRHPDRLQQRGSAILLAMLEEINGLVVDSPLMCQPNSLPPQIVKALEHIEKHIKDPLCIEELARRVGWTHEHFSRLFVQHMGRTPRETIIQCRIERACQLLLLEQWTVKQVAYEVGFNDENYFCKVFKTLKGMTATTYRGKFYNHRRHNLHPVSDLDTPYPPNRILFDATSN